MAKGYNAGDNSHPEKCRCGYKRKPKDQFAKIAGQWVCATCVKDMKR